MANAREIITRAMQNIGVLVKSEPPSADEADDALSVLNSMISSWSNDSLNVYARTWESFPLTSASSYTIGTGGNFNTVRPLDIVEAHVRSGTIDYPITIIDDETYNSISYKNLNGIPQFLNYSNAYPLSVIRLYPLDSSQTLYILSEKAVSGFATLDTEMSLPDGWEDALIYNLALRLAPQYSQEPSALVVKIANDSLGMIRTKVAQVRGMDAFPQNLAVRNIYSGWRY